MFRVDYPLCVYDKDFESLKANELQLIDWGAYDLVLMENASELLRLEYKM